LKRRKLSLSQHMAAIIILTLILLVVSTSAVMYRMEAANFSYFYHLNCELMDSSVSTVEDQLTDLENLTYSLIVCDEVQDNGSRLLETEQDGTSSRRAVLLTEITGEIQRQISENHAVVCANFIDNRGEVQTVASTRYIRLGIQAAEKVNELAVSAGGDYVLLPGTDYTGNEDILIFAREVREKKDLTMRHIGTIVLMVSASKMASVLTDTFDGAVVMRSEDGSLLYVLSRNSSLRREAADNLDLIAAESTEDYKIVELNGSRYFEVVLRDSGNRFLYYALTPYNSLFSEIRRVFAQYLLIFLGFSGAAILMAAFLSHRTTRGVRQFTDYIRKISPSKDDFLPQYQPLDEKDRDVFELERAFNAMSDRINRLVRDNYRKQILAKDAQLSALQSQMNPHFLYNSLNFIYWLAKDEKADETAETISSLSGLLHQTVSNHNPVVTLDEELDIACQYIALQKKRFGDRMIISFDVPGECSSLAVPRFMLQPLIENAITYGVERMVDPCTIRVHVEQRNELCLCQVRDNGPAPEKDLMRRLRTGEITPHGNGVSLLNIDERIRTIYGPQYGIQVYFDEEKRETVVQAAFAAMSVEECLRKQDA
jgi:two-component system sensor histidine kinase YesM